MNKTELKKILKPLIKECIKEVIFEEGSLSTIIAEVVKGTSRQQVVYENKQPQRLESKAEASKRRQSLLQEHKQKMLNAIGTEAYNGVDLFEGTKPMSAQRNASSPQGSKALDGVAPHDPGVDISTLVGNGVWKKLAGN
tara:strand:+ start:736 stop:1152 length:417 start_codon:yes stop_codon:yes gene_type:complete